MKITAEPRSDQWNADDFIGGPRTFTIAGVKVGTAEQKYDIELVEGEGRSWRPPLTMLRLLIAAWGDEAAQWTGRRVTLYRDESVRFGSDAVGGIRISHLSDLPGGKPLTVKLTATRGRRASHTVDPLPDAPAAISDDEVNKYENQIALVETLDDLKALYEQLKSVELGSHRASLMAAVTARKAEIENAGADQPTLDAQPAE